MERANEFIGLYNRLSEHLKVIAGVDSTVQFAQLVALAARKNSAVRRMADRLKDYGDLRNAIVHHRAYPHEVIAEPTEATVSRLAGIVQDIFSPRKLIPAFQKEIHCFSPRDMLITALGYMREHDFSQIVVLRNDSISLLTVEGVARWLEERAEEDIISVKEALIEDAQAYETSSTFAVLPRTSTIYDADETFVNTIRGRQPRLFAIVITQTGKSTEKPIGLVTPWDLLGHDQS
ncbi:MAG: hypothetical protein ACRDFW_01300 [bacterium]